MKAVVFKEGKTVGVEEKPVPTLKANEVLLRVVAVGLNPTDWKHVKFFSKPGDISGCDFVGHVEKLGTDVPASKIKLGELRWGFTRGGLSPERGGFAEYVAVEWDLTSVVPPNITAQEAASIPIPFVTAVQTLYLRLGIPEPPQKANGEWILIWSGATAVGRYAIQLAKLSGLRVATTASAANWDRLKALGADVIVDYKDPDVIKKLKDGTNDSIVYGLDCISEHGSTQQAQRAFAPTGGHLLTLVFDFGDLPRTDVRTEGTIAYTALGFDSFWAEHEFKTSPEDRALYAKWARLATDLFAKGAVKPLDIDIIGNLDSVQSGLEKLKKGIHSNKMVANVP